MTARELIEERLQQVKKQQPERTYTTDIGNAFQEGIYHGAKAELEHLLAMMDILEIE